LYRQPVPKQNKVFVYQLSDQGAIEVRSLVLEHYHPRFLGRLDTDLLRAFIRDKRWVRDAVLYHLEHWSFGRYLPSSNGSHLSTETTPNAEEEEPRLDLSSGEGASSVSADDSPAALQANLEAKPTLRRGSRVTIRHGATAWEAIYWGRNDKGDVVAHNTARHWQLAHVDLKHFGDKVEIGSVLSEDEFNAIANEIAPPR